MSHQRTQGFILFVVLVFLQIFSLWGCYALMNAAMLTKNQYLVWQRNQVDLMAQFILRLLENNVSQIITRCTISLMPSFILKDQPQTWWQLYACKDHLNNTNYYFVLESMGKDPCAVIKNSKQSTLKIA